MKSHLAIALLLTALPAHAEEPAQSRLISATPNPAVHLPPFPGAPTSWLGIDLSKPDLSLVSHLPALPPGVGFLVKTVHEKGPAAQAGIRESDLLWKLDEQLLVNEAQLSALLRLHQPGEEVMLAVFRNGSPLEIPITLAESPLPVPGAAGIAAEEAIFLNEQGPMRVVNLAEREAYITNSEGRATVRRVDDGYRLTIQDSDGTVIFDGSFDRGSEKSEYADTIPTAWKRRAYALRRGLDHAMDGRITPQRQPRPRVVPPAP